METEPDRESFGKMLRRLRLAARMSQEQLAERAQISVAGVSALERGRRRAPYRETLRLISHALRLAEPERRELELAARRPRLHLPPAGASRDLTSPGGRADDAGHNLPLTLSSFVGRETQVAEIAALLGERPLVTLTGAAGVGKTRTSVRVAANLLNRYEDGVWFIDLAPLASAEYVVSAVGHVLGITASTSGDPRDTLIRALRGKQMLLLFDNCEHLVESVARLVSGILRACTGLKILASSREALRIDGERNYRLPALDIPAAVALFADRARSADRRFALNAGNAPDVEEICRRLDGIPLAIELAAARISSLSARQLRDRLDARLQLLGGGNRDALPRQQTLRKTIDWSYDLLDEHERMLFRRLSIFANGFTLNGAASVGSEPSDTPATVFGTLASLVDKSLVATEPAGHETRYRLLESTRVYAREKAELAGEGELTASRHLRYLHARLLDLRVRQEQTARWTELEDAVLMEFDDIRAALDWSRGHERLAPLGGEIVAAIGLTLEVLGLPSEALRRAEACLEAGTDEPLRARLEIVVAWLSYSEMRLARGLEAAASAIAYGRTSGDPMILAEALCAYSWCAMRSLQFEQTQAALDEAQSLVGISRTLHLRLLEYRGILHLLRGDLANAAPVFGYLRDEHRALGNAYELAMVNLLAEVEHRRGQTRAAIELVRGGLADARAHIRCVMLVNLAGYLGAVDDLAGATAVAREAIALADARNPDDAKVAFAIEHLALAAGLKGDLARAATLSGYVDAALRAHSAERTFTETTTRERLDSTLRERLGPEALASRRAEGAALPSDAALTLALNAPD